MLRIDIEAFHFAIARIGHRAQRHTSDGAPLLVSGDQDRALPFGIFTRKFGEFFFKFLEAQVNLRFRRVGAKKAGDFVKIRSCGQRYIIIA